VTGIARRFERGHVIVELGRAEAILPSREQMHRESYRAGDRVQAFVKEKFSVERLVEDQYQLYQRLLAKR
jgi:hypothetical protein